MISFLHPRIRIGIVIVSAFFISGLLMNYSVGETETLAPQIEVKSVVKDFAQSVSDTGSTILTSLQSIRLPTFEYSSPQEEKVTPPVEEPVEEPTESPSQPIIPTSTPAQLFPTYAPRPSIRPTVIGQQPTQSLQPTSAPKPTKIPQPTKIPKPTKIPPPPSITSDVRPGTSIEAILREVSKHACIPYALLMATRTEESGAWMNNMNASVTKYYNTYGWWKTAGKGEVCYALGYYTQSGKIPPDSTTALQEGPSCTNGVQPGAYDQKIMGLMQMSEDEEKVTRKYTSPSLPKNIDRRVLFDNALIYAFATRNRLETVPKSCDDWPEDAVKTVAEKHFGACGYPGGNYCTEIWNLYKKFK